MQGATELIKEGKNEGKKNETTPFTQAEKEAKARHQKQLKKGYVEDINAARAGETDAIIEGGANPMLAQSFDKHAAKISFPCVAQPKLDGIRCIASISYGQVSLWTRTRKRITSMPHIEEALSKAYPDSEITLDGELYSHKYKHDFEKIVSAVRKEHAEEGFDIVEYHIYDVVDESMDFEARFSKAKKLCRDYNPVFCYVRTELMEDEVAAVAASEDWIAQGYEGAMLRNRVGKYEGKRSYNLQKVKQFQDAEFEIVGVTEGRGKLAGHVGSFVCVTESGTEFEAKMMGSLEGLKTYFEDSTLWTGKKLTVKYQGLTGKNQVPRFPVGVAVRDYE